MKLYKNQRFLDIRKPNRFSHTTNGNNNYRKTFLTFLTSAIFVMLISSYAFAFNSASSTYDNQVSTNAGNPYTDLNFPTSSDLTYNYYDLDINHEQNMIIKIGDIDNSGVKSVITFTKGDNEIFYTKAIGNSPQTTQSFTLPTGYVISDLIVIANPTNTANVMWVVMYSFTEVKIVEANLVSGSFNILYTFEDGLANNYLPYGEFSCNEYTIAGSKRTSCVYQTTKNNTIINLKSFGLQRYLEMNIPQVNAETFNIVINDDVSTKKSQIHLVSNGNSILYLNSAGSVVSKASFSDCTTIGDVCTITTITNSSAYNNVHSDLKKVIIDNIEYVMISSVNAPDFSDSGYTTGKNVAVIVYDTNLNVIYSFNSLTSINVGGVTQYVNLNPSVVDYSGTGENICFSILYGSSFVTNLYAIQCINNSISGVSTIVAKTSTPYYLQSGYTNGVDNYITYYTGSNLYFKNSATTKTIQNSKINVFVGGMIFDDIGGNGIADLIGVSETGGFYATLEEETPSTLTIYYPYVYNYYNPSCTNETILFKMSNGKYSAKFTFISDNNDATEKTKICTSCGGTQNYSCGSYSLATPQISCSNFSVAGNYNVTFYAYTDLNENTPVTFKDYLTEQVSNSFTINLEVADDNCGLVTDYVDSIYIGGEPVVPDDNETGTGGVDGEIEDIDDLLDVFGFGSSLWKIIFGIAIVFGVTFYAFNETKSFGMAIIGFVGSLILTTYLGLIPIWIIILLGFLVIGILASSKIFSSNG